MDTHPASGSAILLSGDVCLENLELLGPNSSDTSSSGSGKNDNSIFHFEAFPQVRRYSLEGGAWLVGKILSNLAPGVEITLPSLRSYEEGDSPLLMRAYSLQSGGGNPYWIDRMAGYYLDPQSRSIQCPVDGRGKSMAVFYEEGNHFKFGAKNLPNNLEKNAAILYKMSGPAKENPFWNSLSRLPGLNPENLVVIVSAGDLRKEMEVSVSKSISWEATALDMAFHLTQSAPLASFFHCAHLIVLFDYEGAFYYQNYQGGRMTLFFDPANLEGQFQKQFPGGVFGKEAVFTAILANYIYREDPGLRSLAGGIERALRGMGEWLRSGYSLQGGAIQLPFSALQGGEKRFFSAINVPHPRSLFEPDPVYWTILDEKVAHTRRVVAENIVRHGDDRTLRQVPEIRFGKVLKAIDRSEIERLSGIWKLLAEYMDHPTPGRPLCLAVFGSPGSGKSFSINQIAERIDSKRIYKLTFNLSQFREYAELPAAFHKIRNINLTGKIPLVFFDEFDADGLKWLKYFLAPMQDGEFMEGGALYNLGAAIFVFAGGAYATFEEFSAGGQEEANRQLKLPDFVSRLRGFINIKGPNPVANRKIWDDFREEEWLWRDENFIIRRAKLIRSLMERLPHVRDLFDKDKKDLHIDPGVLRALLLIPAYKHGIRSIEAILEMSRLGGKKLFDKAALPPEDQLALHVDRDSFRFLLEKERFLEPARHPDDFIRKENDLVKRIAAGIHREYVRYRKTMEQAVKATEDFEALKTANFPLYLSNIHAAREAPQKLLSIGIGIREMRGGGTQDKFPVFSDEEVCLLARWEHQRWYRERNWAGRQAPAALGAPVHPYLTEWDDLPDSVKEIDYEAIRSLPFILEQNGLTLFRMEEIEEVDEHLIDALARVIHQDYLAQRSEAKSSDSADTSMAPYDQLAPAIRLSNVDHAMHITTRLKEAGYAIRKALPGASIRLMRFSGEEIERMAEWEHRRWCWHKWRQGYIYKPGKKDDENRTHPDLIPYGQLSDEVKEYDRRPVRVMPELLKRAGYEICRL
jgi:hypothetical protein